MQGGKISCYMLSKPTQITAFRTQTASRWFQIGNHFWSIPLRCVYFYTWLCVSFKSQVISRDWIMKHKTTKWNFLLDLSQDSSETAMINVILEQNDYPLLNQTLAVLVTGKMRFSCACANYDIVLLYWYSL